MSIMNNSVFVTQENAWNNYPAVPGTNNYIANRHPAKSGNINYFDGHVKNIADIESKYWAEDEYWKRVQVIWWPYVDPEYNP